MNKLDRIERLRIARKHAAQGEQSLIGMSMPRPHVGEARALMLLGRAVKELDEAITSLESASKVRPRNV